MIKIDPKRCPQNHKCPAIRVCPFDALIQNGHGLPEVDPEKCTLCLTCISYCPMGAIKDAELPWSYDQSNQRLTELF